MKGNLSLTVYPQSSEGYLLTIRLLSNTQVREPLPSAKSEIAQMLHVLQLRFVGLAYVVKMLVCWPWEGCGRTVRRHVLCAVSAVCDAIKLTIATTPTGCSRER